MSVVRLVNPVDAIGNAIAEPLEQAAKEFKQLRDLHDNANQHLKQSGHDLEVTMGKDIAQPFADMINKQYQFADGINRGIDQIADLYNEAAQGIRTAAHWVNPILTVSFDLLQWAVDQLTADIVVRQGQSAVQAIFDDLRRQVDRAEHDAGSFFGDLFHLHFNAALHDAEDAGKALLHMAGDALAMIAQVEPLLCQWAEDIFQKVNWCFNQVNSVLLGIVDWVLGLSDMVDEAVVFTDPNSTDLEKWVAGTMLTVNIGLDILMFIPGGQEAIFGRLAEKLGIKFLTRWIAAKIAETIVAQLIKDFIKRLLTKFAESVVRRALEKSLTKAVFQNLENDIKLQISAYIRMTLEKWSAGNITLAEAHAEIRALVDFANKYGADRLKYILSNYDEETLRVILNGDHLPALHPGQQWEVWHLGPNQPGTTVPRNFIMRAGDRTYYVNANATKHLAEYALSAGKKTGNFGFPMSAIATVLEKAQADGLLKPGTGKQFFRIGSWELGIDTNENVIYHMVYRP
jgi:hypothetical protein